MVPMKKLVASAALVAALVVPGTAAQAEESCRVCVKPCGSGYVVYWYNLQGHYEEILNACIIQA
jgi:hypothetical protein